MPSTLSLKGNVPNAGDKFKLSKTIVDGATEPGIYKDREISGFRLRVGESGVKSYQYVGKVKGRPKTIFITIGKHGQPWTPESARSEAKRLQGLMRLGVNPVEQLKEETAKSEAFKAQEESKRKTKELTLKLAFEELLDKEQKTTTEKVYRWIIGKHFKDWLEKPLIDITQDDVVKRYDEIKKGSKSSAAHAMRILRAIYHTAQIKHGELIPELSRINPVRILSHGRKGWNRVEPREEYINDEDLPAFYKGVRSLQNKVAQDYLLICILTGLRKSEVCNLKWEENINLQRRTITIKGEHAKNKQRHMLAMSDYLYELFLKRWQVRENEYVLPGRGANGNFSDPEKLIGKVIEHAGIDSFSSHSLRRTFAKAADALGYNLHEVQRLLNHKPGTVTEKHYIQNVVDRTKEPMQRINDHLLKLMKAKKTAKSSANVVALSKRKAAK